MSVCNLTLHFLVALLLFPGVNAGLGAEGEGDDSQDAFLAAVAALKAHVTGETALADEEIASHRKTIDASNSLLGDQPAVIKACFDLIRTYDKESGPLWLAYDKLNKKQRNAGDEIHWAIFWVMQHVVDEVYTSENIARYGDLLNGFRFGSADVFPGKVEQTVHSDAVYKVSINGSYPETWGPPVFQEERPARKPTGAYLVPGTIATVTVPPALVNKGYQVRVGAHDWDLSKKPRVTRLYRCSLAYDITNPAVQVANPLGGGIYIEVPYLADAGVVEVAVRNAARSPYYSAKPFHRTTLTEWRETERNFKAPWADFQSEKFMMQVPTSWIYQLEDPETLMRDWDRAMDVTNDLMGYPHQHGRETLYTQVDTQLRGRAFHPGYPSVNRGYDPKKDYGGNYQQNHLVSGPRDALNYEFHEMGHGFLFPKYSGDWEAAVNLLHVAVMNRAFDVDLMEAFRGSRGQANTFCNLETTAVAWMMSDHFVETQFMEGYERQYQLKGHAKFVDIARLFGWQVLDDFWRSTNQDFEDGHPWDRDVTDTDAYTLRLSQQAGVDLRPLIHFWGIPTQDNAASDATMQAAGLKPSTKIYDQLMVYQNRLPADNQAFRDFALKWWEKQPSAEGFTTERNHAARWDSYDQAAAAEVRAVMQKTIIDRYFPGRPPVPDSK